MNTVLCMRWGTRYRAPYVNRLYGALTRHVSGPFRLVCLTDDASGIRPEVDCHPLPPIPLPDALAWTPWRKLSVWRAPLLDLVGDVLFLDLDLIVAGGVDDFFTYRPGAFVAAENWTQRGRAAANTSVFRFPAGRHGDVLGRFEADPASILSRYRTEQAYVSDVVPEMTFWPQGWCRSFKHDLVPSFPANWWRAPRLPEDAKVVAFTGRPDVPEAARGHWPAPWYKRAYKHARPAPWVLDHWREEDG